MNIRTLSSPWFLVIVAVVFVAVWEGAQHWPRSDALLAALQGLIDQKNTDQARVAKAILDNYREIRSDTTRWSGVYWSLTFGSAILSALAGFLLKVESVFKNAEWKKDVAAALSLVAALLITISTSGSFERKWQANRIAAAQLERTGYQLLQDKTGDPRRYFATIGDILYKRNLAIVGTTEDKSAGAKSDGQSPSSE